MGFDVIVIGAGTVGAAIAYGLARTKLSVLVLDGADGDYRAARANFGLVWLQGKGRDMPAYQQLTRHSIDLWPQFNAELSGLSATDLQYERNGGLVFCCGEDEFENRRMTLQRLHNQLGGAAADWEMLDRTALAKLLPAIELGPDVSGASFGRRDGHANPLRLLAALHCGILRLGGVLRGDSAIKAITTNSAGFTVDTGSEHFSAPRLVIAAGLGSQALARQVDLEIPLRPQRGQTFVTERLAPFLPLPASGLRQTREGTVMIGATQEETGFDISTTSEAAAALSRKAVRVVPALADVRLVRQWAGLRVMTPDSYPIYAQSQAYPGAFVTLCHSGVTLAALHASVIADAIAAGALPASSMFFTKGVSMFRKLHDPGVNSVTIYIDNAPVSAEAGESIAAVLLRQGEIWSRTTPVTQSKRAPYCLMGVCFDCLAEVDGIASVQTCLTPVRDGMRIARQIGKRSLVGKRSIGALSSVDLLIVGAGPAGMAAAVTARRFGLDVLVVDDQPAPGGQIWRAVETVAALPRGATLGDAYRDGKPAVEAFRASGAAYQPGSQLWQIEPGLRAFVTRDGKARTIAAKAVLLATGALERPVPFPGWTLPGVLTVGAAQILLKSAGQVPAKPVWLAGSGPLALLYLTQLLRAGGQIAGYLDTTPPGRLGAALPHLPKALRAAGDLMKGLGWVMALKRRGVRTVKHVMDVEAIGSDKIEAIRYRTTGGEQKTVAADTLLIHEEIVPNIHAPLALGCNVQWLDDQDCYVPILDPWGESSQANVFIAGDGAGIAGAKAAAIRGELAALRIAVKLERAGEAQATAVARPLRRRLGRELALRPFLEAMFRPRAQIFAPSDDTIVCRCEEVTARDIRAMAAIGRPGPNQVKAFTRAGMGPCQGRQCGYTVTRILAEAENRPAADVGFYRVRPPLKPVTLGELASLDQLETTP